MSQPAFQITPKRVKPGEQRIKMYEKMRDEGVSETKYRAKLGAVTDETLKPFEDLSQLDSVVGALLNQEEVVKWDRIKYLAFARELYKYFRKYGELRPSFVAIKISEYADEYNADRDLLTKIAKDIFGVPTGAQAGGGRARRRGGGGGGEQPITLGAAPQA